MPTQKLAPSRMVMKPSLATAPLPAGAVSNGVTIVSSGSPLTLLNYFDGKFLRAADLLTEQNGLRMAIQLSNQTGGPGVAYGFSAQLQSGTQILLSSGLAVDPLGRLLLMTEGRTLYIPDLLSAGPTLRLQPKSMAGAAFGDCMPVSDPDPEIVNPTNLYLLVIAHAEALCGEENVYGKLCQEACVTSTDRPFRVEGVVARLVPLTLQTPLPASSAVTLTALHLRSRVASAYFEDERHVIEGLISKDGLQSELWCLGADGTSGTYVPLGVVGWSGSGATFLDAWTARRERMDPPCRRYWQWRMAMRPWDVFVAQILQFQCQLRDGLQNGPEGGSVDPCRDTRKLVGEAAAAVTELHNFFQAASAKLATARIDTTTAANLTVAGGSARVTDLLKRLSVAQRAKLIQPLNRLLIRQGFVQVPSAGYLPVTPGDAMTVNEQVRQWMGEGVNLRFCIVRPDYVQHAIEAVQHMERISLTGGLDNPQDKPDVDILVPNGKIGGAKPAEGTEYEAVLSFAQGDGNTSAALLANLKFNGAAFIDAPATGSIRLATALDMQPQAADNIAPNLAGMVRSFVARQPAAISNPRISSFSFWLAGTCSLNPFRANEAGEALIDVRISEAAVTGGNTHTIDVVLNGKLQFDQPQVQPATSGSVTFFKGTFSGTITSTAPNSSQRNSPRQATFVVQASLLTPGDQPPSLEFSATSPELKTRVDAKITWSENPRDVEINVSLTPQSVATTTVVRPVWSASFTQNNDVLLPTNVWHSAALNGLNKLGTALVDPQFPPRSEAILFPPPPPPSDDLQVLATLDWVVFVRRRTRQCQPDKPVVTIPTRRYQLWHGTVASQDFLKATINALHDKTTLDPKFVTLQRVDVPEFAPGIATLLTSADSIRSDWSNIHPGAQVLYGAIASSDAAKQEGDSLALARLNSLEQAVALVSPPAAGAKAEVLPDIHPGLAVPDVDGVIVLLTMLQKVDHHFFELPAEALQSLVKVVSPASATISLPVELARFQAKELGTVTFRLKTSEALGNSVQPVVDKWTSHGFGTPGSAVTFSVNGDAADLIGSRKDQANLILAKLGAAESVTSNSEVTQQPLGPLAPAVTVISPGGIVEVERPSEGPTPGARVARLVPWRGNQSNRTVIDLPAPLVVRFEADGSLPGGIPAEEIAALKKVGKFGSVELVTAETPPDAGAQKRLDVITHVLVSDGLVAAGATTHVTKLRPKEKPLLSSMGADFDELVFLLLG